MEGTLDIQRDHVAVLGAAMRLLEPHGRLLFSTNRRGFRLDTQALEDVVVRDVTDGSFDPDFNRKPVPHRLYLLQHIES